MTKKEERPDYLKMIPELQSYFGKQPVDLVTWLDGIGRYDHALAYAALFWPDFAEVEGSVFLASALRERCEDWKAKEGNDPSRARALLNHLHLFDLFGSHEAPAPEVVRLLGMRLKEM